MSDDILAIEVRGKIVNAQIEHLEKELDKLRVERIDLRRRYADLRAAEIRNGAWKPNKTADI